tara:strand:- start:79 stop:897 length:819 start_codon:yes stop_codon:yes gene_type:complete
MNNTINAAMDFMSLGLDPEKSTFWVQSDVPQVCESTWLLSNVVNLGLLDRSTSYKDKLSKGLTPNLGLYSYPVLMASDILLFGGEIVPVGQDQKQHLEITRDIATRFNNIYGEVFVIPEPEIEKSTKLIPGIDGQKMSKSYGNTIPLFGEEKNIRKKFMSIVTDSTDIQKPKDTDTALFHLFSLFLNKSEKEELANRFMTPGMRYGDIKKELFECFWSYFEPFREKRIYLENHKDFVFDNLKKGAEKASLVAEGYMNKARHAMGLNFGSTNV